MRKTSKILVLVLVLTMMFAMTSMFTASAAETVRVYCKNEAGWTNVYCYYWGETANTWPGDPMTYDADTDRWYYDVPAGTTNCIFNNNAGTQSADLVIPADEDLVFNNVGLNPVKLFARVPDSWNNVNCHNWRANGASAWPGDPMTKLDNGLWFIELPYGTQGCVLNNGSEQTVDITSLTNEDYEVTLNEKGSDGKYTATATVHAHDFAEGKCSVCGAADPDYVAPHVNKLVVGETNKIVVDGSQTNAYNLPVAWVQFTVEEAARYTFLCAEEGALALIYTTDGTVYDYYGVSANLAPGTYWVCVGGGTTGDFNVTVYQTPSQNTAITASPLFPCFYNILVDGELSNGVGPVVWVEFTVTQEAHYKFDCDKAPALIYTSNADFMDFTTYKGAEADLTEGTYYVLVGGTGDTGYFNLSVTQTAIEQGGDDPVDPPVTPELPKLQLGDNTVVIDGTTTNLTGNAIAWLELVVKEAGTYAITSADLNCYIYSEMNLTDFNACLCGFSGVATLEPGTYYVCVGKEGVTGEFTVSVDNGTNVEVPHKNTMVVGDNHYIITDNLYAIGYEFITIEITQPGTYVVTGGAPMKVYMWTILGEMDDRNFGWNVDTTYEGGNGFAPSFEVVITEPGTYWVGFNYDFVKEDPNAPMEYDINISLKAEEPQPEPELNFFQKIIAWFMDIIQKILGFFKK